MYLIKNKLNMLEENIDQKTLSDNVHDMRCKMFNLTQIIFYNKVYLQTQQILWSKLPNRTNLQIPIEDEIKQKYLKK